jgi:hypothetical protein
MMGGLNVDDEIMRMEGGNHKKVRTALRGHHHHYCSQVALRSFLPEFMNSLRATRHDL